jgi:3-isopropylmalate/(R)-2-methylmalate dehydratase large subunit
MVASAALEAGKQIPDGVDCYIQFGSKTVKQLSFEMGWTDLFERAGIQIIDPGCGACIGAGPGVSDDTEQVTISAINRNFQGRSGPGKLYLASPLTVMASAFMGQITAWNPNMFK